MEPDKPRKNAPPAAVSPVAATMEQPPSNVATPGSNVLQVETVSPESSMVVHKQARSSSSAKKKKKKKMNSETSSEKPNQKTTETPSESLSLKKKSNKKTYLVMAHEAIVALKDRSGSSLVAITKHMLSENPHVQEVPPQVFRSRLGLALKSGVKAGRLVKVKASYKINSEWTKKQKNLEKKRHAQKAAADKKSRAQRQEEQQQKRAAERETQRRALLQKAQDPTSDLTQEERHAILEKLRKQEQAKAAKERAERLQKERAERLKKRRFPMEDTHLHEEDKELGVKPPASVKRRPALPTIFSCLHPPTRTRRNTQLFSVASKCDTAEGHGLVSDILQVYHFFWGDVGFGTAQKAVPENMTMQTLLHATQEILVGNMKRTKMVPPLLSHLFVTSLQWLLHTTTHADLKPLQQCLGPASWGEVCFQYMDAMERYYTTHGGKEKQNVVAGSPISSAYLFGVTQEQPEETLLPSSSLHNAATSLPSGYGAYLGGNDNARGALSRAFAKLETKDPWNLTAEELFALLRALTDDVLATRDEISTDLAQRDEQMYELLKAKRSADSQFRKIRLAYEGPRRPKAKSGGGEKENDNDENETSEGRKSLDSQSSDTKEGDEEEVAFKPTASKRQFEAATKAQIKANDAYEKGLRTLVSRREPVGYDRNFNAVYFFNHDPSMLYVEVLKTPPKTDKGNPCEFQPRKSNWHVIETKTMFDQFVESLDIRGKRENELYEELMGPAAGGSSSVRRFLFDDIKERNEKASRIKEFEDLERRLANARIACAAEEEEGGRRSGRLATRAQIELCHVQQEMEKLEKRIQEDKVPKSVNHEEMTGLEALRTFDHAGRRETRRMREEAKANLLTPMPCSILWSTGNLDGTGIVGSVVAELLELEEFCESLSPWERENGGRSAWIRSLEHAVHAWNHASPPLLGPPSKTKSGGDILASLPGTPDAGSKRGATDYSPRSEEKRRRLDSPSSAAAGVSNQSVPQILALLKPLLLELEERVFEVTGLAMQTRDADEADDNMSVATNEDDEDMDNEDREKMAWKKKVHSLRSIPTSRYGQVREVLVEAIAAARKAHLSGVVAELRSALLLHHPNAAGECKSAALEALARHGGYDPEDDDSSDESDVEEEQDDVETEKEEAEQSVLSGEAMMINGSLKGDKNANRVDWVDAVKDCKTVSRFAALVFAFVKNADELLIKIQGEEKALQGALKKWEKEEERLKRARGAKSSNKNPPKKSFDVSTEVWTNVRYTDNFCMAKVENSPAWPAKHCEPKDAKLAESLKSVQRVLVAMIGEDGLRVVKAEDISGFTGKPIETDLSEYSKDMRSLLNECLAMARRIIRGRKGGHHDTMACVEEKKSAI